MAKDETRFRDLSHEHLARIIDWRMRSPSVLKSTKLSAITEGRLMQRQFTIELRVDYADHDKNEVMRDAVKAAARHVLATARLLSDSGMRPEIMVCSDDFFAGNEEINILDDVIQQGLDETNLPDETVSSELMAAVRDSVGEDAE